jgi:hypothetical protein
MQGVEKSNANAEFIKRLRSYWIVLRFGNVLLPPMQKSNHTVWTSESWNWVKSHWTTSFLWIQAALLAIPKVERWSQFTEIFKVIGRLFLTSQGIVNPNQVFARPQIWHEYSKFFWSIPQFVYNLLEEGVNLKKIWKDSRWDGVFWANGGWNRPWFWLRVRGRFLQQFSPFLLFIAFLIKFSGYITILKQ